MSISISILLSNDIRHDRRMLRIARSLQSINDTRVKIIGVSSRSESMEYESVSCQLVKTSFGRGVMFYFSLNVALYKQLIKDRPRIVYCVDIDTIPAGRIYKLFNKVSLVLDCHEWYEYLPELQKRPIKRSIWRLVSHVCIPGVDLGFTVSESISRGMGKLYHKDFQVIRNLPMTRDHNNINIHTCNTPLILVYLGKINPGRGVAELIEIIKQDQRFELWIIGDGPLLNDMQMMARDTANIRFYGLLHQSAFGALLDQCDVGVNLLDPSSKSYQYSLANKFFDYAHHGLAVLSMDFPEYRLLNRDYPNSILCSDLSTSQIRESLNSFLILDKLVKMKEQSLRLASDHHWESEESKLLSIIKAKVAFG